MDNNEIASAILAQQEAHIINLDHFTDKELIKIYTAMTKVENEIVQAWGKTIKTKFSQSQAFTMLEEARDMMKGIKEALPESIAKSISKVSVGSAEVHSAILSFGGAAANVKDVALQEPLMTAFWKTTPVGGHLLKDWVSKTFDETTVNKIQQEIGAGLFKSESFEQLAKRLQDGFSMTRTQVDTLVRTYVHTANMDALQRTFEANSDIIKRVRWSAARNMRTCLLCAYLDGHLFELKDHPPCPVHPRCRCTLVPDTSLSKLGLDKEAAKAWVKSKHIDPADMKGQLFQKEGVKSDMQKWIGNLTKESQKKFFGPKRWQLLDSGDVDFDDLVDLSDIKSPRIRLLSELQGDTELKAKAKIGDAEAIAELEAKEAKKKVQSVLEHGKIESMAKNEIAKAAEEEAAEIAKQKAKEEALAAAKKAEEEALAAAKKKAHSEAVKAGFAKKKEIKQKLIVGLNDLYKNEYPSKEEVAKYLVDQGLTNKQADKEAGIFVDAKGPAPKPPLTAVSSEKKPAIPVQEKILSDDIINADKFEKVGTQKGSNEGGFYKDPATGQEYYFKFIDENHAKNEVLASKLYAEVDIDVPELSRFNMDGRTGLASKVVDGLEQDGSKLTAAGSVINDSVKKEMAFDAWLANWDVVGIGYDNLLVKGDRAFRVDVGGSLLYRAQGASKGAAFGAKVGELETFVDAEKNPYSAKVFSGITREQIIEGVKKVASISDERIKEIVKTYASEDEADRVAGILIERKNWLLKEYPEAAGGAGSVVPPIAEGTKTVTIGSAVHSAVPGISDAFIQDIDSLGFQGKSLPFDGDYIEDQNALVFTEKYKKTKRTVVKMKVRLGRADENIVDTLSKVAVKEDGTVGTMQPLKEDVFFDDILAATKNAAYHNGIMTQMNPDKWQAMLKAEEQLTKLAATVSDDDSFNMAIAYLKQIEAVKKAVEKEEVSKTVFEQFKVEVKPSAKTEEIKNAIGEVKITNIQRTKRSTVDGEMTVVKEKVPLSKFFSTGKNKIENSPGVQYEIAFPDGIKATYIPWKEDNFYALRGDMEITIPEGASPQAIKSALDKLRILGVDAGMATEMNTEKMYLEKIAYITRNHKSVEWQDMIRDTEGLDIKEQVKARRELLSKELGVPDVTKLPDYNPAGEYQIGFLDREKSGGQRLQYRPDISKEELAEQMKGYALVHKVTNSPSMAEALKLFMGNNGAMISTVEKTRLGIAAGGMSPADDMRTGGANYFFTRITNASYTEYSHLHMRSNMIVFKKDMLRRCDAISYDSDNFGRTTDTFVENNRVSNISGFKDCAASSTNETIFKQSVTIMDNVEYFIANDEDDRIASIKVLKDLGITHTPDGKPIEEIIILLSDWEEKAKTI